MITFPRFILLSLIASLLCVLDYGIDFRGLVYTDVIGLVLIHIILYGTTWKALPLKVVSALLLLTSLNFVAYHLGIHILSGDRYSTILYPPWETERERGLRRIRNDTNTMYIFYHGTKWKLAPGDIIGRDYAATYGFNPLDSSITFTTNLNVAVWFAELSRGEGRGHIYFVEPLGYYTADDESDTTNNSSTKRRVTPRINRPPLAYRTTEGLRILREIDSWHGHAPEDINRMRHALNQRYVSESVPKQQATHP